MRKLLLIFLILFFGNYYTYSQDQIIRTNGKLIDCEIISIDSSKIDFILNPSKVKTYISLKDVYSYKTNGKYKYVTDIVKKSKPGNNNDSSEISLKNDEADFNRSYLILKKVKNNKIIKIEVNDKVLVGIFGSNGKFKIRKARLIDINGEMLIFQPISKKYNIVKYDINTLTLLGYRTTGSVIFGYTLGTFEIALFCLSAAAASVTAGSFFIFPHIRHITYVIREFPSPKWEISIQHEEKTLP